MDATSQVQTASEALGHHDPISPRRFKNSEGEVKYGYFFDELTAEQCAVLEALFQWKQNIVDNPAQSFNDIQRSGFLDWFVKCAAVLLIPTDLQGDFLSFDYSKRDKAEAFVKSLKRADKTRLEECLEDFFTRGTRLKNVSLVLYGHRSLIQQTLKQAMRDSMLKEGSQTISSK